MLKTLAFFSVIFIIVQARNLNLYENDLLQAEALIEDALNHSLKIGEISDGNEAFLVKQFHCSHSNQF
jgi:hypothetical protein